MEACVAFWLMRFLKAGHELITHGNSARASMAIPLSSAPVLSTPVALALGAFLLESVPAVRWPCVAPPVLSVYSAVALTSIRRAGLGLYFS
jgi:hypothetical protein